MIGRDDEFELVGNADRAFYIERRAGRRDIAHDAVDSTAVKLDRSGFQGAMPRKGALFIGHGRGTHLRHNAVAMR